MNEVYMYSIDDQHFYGDFTSREDAVAAGFENCQDASEVYVGRRVFSTAHCFVDGESILELINERACYLAGECAEGWTYDPSIQTKQITPEKIAEFEQLVGDWLQANAPPRFYSIEDVEHVLRQTGDAA